MFIFCPQPQGGITSTFFILVDVKLEDLEYPVPSSSLPK
jgi:hypothetical protein